MKTVRRSSPRSNRASVRSVFARGLAVAAVLGALAWLSISLISGTPGRNYEHIDAVVPDPGSLIKFDPVRMGGVRVGQLQSISATRDGDALLHLQLNPGTKLAADTGLLVRANGLLGSRFVELVPGHSKTPLADGATLHGGKNSLTFGVPEALDTFDPATRRAFRPMLGELATGLAGRGDDVNDLLRVGAQTVPPSTQLFQTLNQQPDANARLLPGLVSMMTTLDANRQQLFAFFGATGDALAPFVQERQATRDTLSEAPGALSSATSGLTAASRLLAATRVLSARATTTLAPAPAALRETEAFLSQARRPLRRTEPLLRTAAATVRDVLHLTSRLDPVLNPMTQLFNGLLPVVHTIGPYGCDVKNFSVALRSMTGVGNRQPGGAAGSPKQFRLQVPAPNPGTTFSIDNDGLNTTDRVAYPKPCQFLSKPYPVVDVANPSGTTR